MPILPDGCRDLICRERNGQPPEWFVSPLQSGVFVSQSTAGQKLSGFRLRPGVRIEKDRLLNAVKGLAPEDDSIPETLAEFTDLPAKVQTSLACLTEATSIKQSAADLGVSMRSLQRMLLRETGQNPAFWRQLARVRQAARQIGQNMPLSEVAFTCGFADQAHMTRDFQRWFATSPAAFVKAAGLTEQLSALGYG